MLRWRATMTRRLPLAAVCLVLLAGHAGAQGRIEGLVFDSLRTGAALAGATVGIAELNRYAVADNRGRYRFDSVPEGTWSLQVLHPSLDSLDLQLPPRVVELRGRRRLEVPLFTPSTEAVYRALCRSARDADAGVIIGRVREVTTGTSLPDAVVHTEWTEYVVSVDGTRSRRTADSARTNGDGVYVLCDVPLQTTLDLRVVQGAQRAGPVRVLVDDGVIRRADLAMSVRDDAGPDGMPRGRARLTGRVLGPDGTPQAFAVVTVVGGRDTVRTNEDGRFALTGLGAGSRTIEIGAIGAEPRVVAVALRPDTTSDTTVTLTRAGQPLQKYVVRAKASSWSLMNQSGFEKRRLVGLGAFVTAEQLERVSYPTLVSILQSMRGVSVEYDGRGFPLPYLRGMAGGRCIPRFYVDNTPMAVDGASPSAQVLKPYSDIEAFVPPRSIKGIEVYASPGGIPPQFDQTALGGCGSIVIWTR